MWWNTTPKRKTKAYDAFLAEVFQEYNTNGKKTILLVCDSFFPVLDGVINVLDNYAKQLSKCMNVVVLAPCTKGKVYVKSYPVIGVRAGFSKKIGYQVALPFLDLHFRKLLKNLRIDIIHCHSPFFLGRSVLRLGRKRGVPVINTFHTQFRRDFVKIVGDNFLADILVWFILKVFRESDEVWTMWPAVGDVLTSYGYRGDFFYIQNATTLAPPTHYAEERRLGREKFGLGEKFTFLFVGRLVTQKNVLFIAEVLGELKRRGLDFKMIFMGEGPDRNKLVAKLKAEDVEERTVFTGQIADIQELCRVYAASDLLLFPSLYDAQSLVQIEAASRYTPTVFAENSVTSASVTKGVNGYAFPCEKETFTEGVLSIVQDKEGLQRCAEQAYHDLYVTWDAVIEKVYQQYLTAMQEKKGKK